MRPEKATIVEDIQAKLNQSPFLLVTDYTGLRVDQFSELRTRLAGAGAECRVVKNTFLRRAAKEAGLPDMGDLKGQTAIVIGEKDVASAAKVLKSFTAEFKKPIVKVGIVDRVVVSDEQIKVIADLPAREILLAQLLGVLQSPAQTFVRLLNEPASALARVLKAHSDKLGEQQPAEAPESKTPEVTAPVPQSEEPRAETVAAAPPASNVEDAKPVTSAPVPHAENAKPDTIPASTPNVEEAQPPKAE